MIAVLGAGPHGQQIAALFRATAVLYDDHLAGFRPCSEAIESGYPFFVGAAWPAVRRQIAEKACAAGGVSYHSGSVQWPGVKFGHDIHVGRHTHVEFNAVIAHGCRIGDYVTICPGAVLCGEVTVEDDVFIGAGAVIIHGGITVGQGAVIGAGAVVLADVAPGATMVGNPARPIYRRKWRR